MHCYWTFYMSSIISKKNCINLDNLIDLFTYFYWVEILLHINLYVDGVNRLFTHSTFLGVAFGDWSQIENNRLVNTEINNDFHKWFVIVITRKAIWKYTMSLSRFVLEYTVFMVLRFYGLSTNLYMKIERWYIDVHHKDYVKRWFTS